MNKFIKFTILIGVVFLFFYFIYPYFTLKEVAIVKKGEAVSDSSCYQKLISRDVYGETRETVCRTKIKWDEGREEIVKLPFPLLKGERVKFCKVTNRYFFVFPNTYYEYRR